MFTDFLFFIQWCNNSYSLDSFLQKSHILIFSTSSADTSKLKDNFYRRIDKNDELQFLDSSTLNHALCLEIAEGTFGNKAISYEDLCHKIPRKIGSRSTILNSLNNAVSKKYFIKESVDYDKRIKIYKLSSNFQTVMIEWINELKKVTNEIE